MKKSGVASEILWKSRISGKKKLFKVEAAGRIMLPTGAALRLGAGAI